MKNIITVFRRFLKLKKPLGLIIGSFFVALFLSLLSGAFVEFIYPELVNEFYIYWVGAWWIIIAGYFLYDEWPNNNKNKLLRAMYLLALNNQKHIDSTQELVKRSAEKCFKCGRRFVSDENFIDIDYETTACIDNGILTHKEILGDVYFLNEFAFDRNSDIRIEKPICIDCINKYFEKKVIFTDGHRIITPRHFFSRY